MISDNTNKLFFSLIRSAISGDCLSVDERKLYSSELLPNLLTTAKKHDLTHLLAVGLKKNGFISEDNKGAEKEIMSAVYRYEQLNYEYICICDNLEFAKIPFIPLKGSVIRKYYPEPWMRTSCDIDILIHRENLDDAISYLMKTGQYELKERGLYDVALFNKQGVHIELHFDLIEEGRISCADDILNTVWENVTLKSEYNYWYEMTDEFFYFYHMVHMAKHFENGGCGVRPYIDLWILDNIEGADKVKRDELLEKGGLLKFTEISRKLSRCWLNDEFFDETLQKLQDYILSGGVYGTSENRVALNQQRKGGRLGYLFSRMFIPYSKLKRYYPVLEKHRWLTPFMQVRRWFMLFDPQVANMAKNELSANGNTNNSETDAINDFLSEIGL